ncbi:MAG: DoxX family protein [Bacteroidales bacterium]|nr:DoxX family protein [Bacteroidales bacterium]MDD7103457.1 DoxX family protein [Bacteroidales bacterium]MDY3354856.1 DoxX family protein [Prevotella sp.]
MKRAKAVALYVARTVVGLTFILSGFVKAIDPLGTQYKIQDYLAAIPPSLSLPDMLTLLMSVSLSMVEFTLGAFMLTAISRRLTARLTLLFMVVMTAVTVWIYIADPVKDCGCFGDALTLTNLETLLKNIVLLALAALVAWRPTHIGRLMSRSNQMLLGQMLMVTPVALSFWCLYDLPLIDFRPYHIGADIKAGMEIPEGAEQPVFDTTFIMEKDGERREFTLDNYPDSTWTFVDSKTVTVKEGYVPPIHDFSITAADGEDITDMVLGREGYTFLLISPDLDKADDQNFGDIDQIYEFCQDNSIPFYCLTASTEKSQQHWQNITGAEYPFCMTDATTLKTMIRSNPGLMLLEKGVVRGKWSHNRLPETTELETMLKAR